tara:strand:- start:50 stop:994 length:945 start_codon:yes stop_codon:yes gene_type:complete
MPGDYTMSASENSRTFYVFPADIENHNQFMHFRISKQYRFGRQKVEEKDTYATITLPVPLQLQTSYAAQYNSQSLGLIGSAAANEMAGVSPEGAIDKLKSIAGRVADISASDVKDAATNLGVYYAPEVATVVTGAVSGALSGPVGLAAGAAMNQAAKGAQAGLGVARNPYLAAVFEGVNFKSHNFSFTLTPRSQYESETLQGIIGIFRNAMLPTMSKLKYYYDYPKQFGITFMDESFLFDIKTSVLTQFDVNYHSKGPSYHNVSGKKAPVEVTLNMNFLETVVRTSGDEGSTRKDAYPKDPVIPPTNAYQQPEE